ncbi:hypothetical protein SAMN05216276_1006196 [Streptosporangium subroseum]|uniref:Uncharacterized protein n=1 Tax=Streptosporangium subroseum TaxID=106412 RepID=A0A239D2V0_9ACTN|nr:hypothetical protein [Streptosporangium subroseum]SNS25923.1 hypothetical protein SAMN05216276_1006196 [Streptosporangium subroseum]
MYEWTEGERWLAAFVAQAAGDREELRRTLVAEFGGAYPDLFQYTRWLDPGKWIAGLARELITPGSDPGLPEPEPVDPWAGASFRVHVMAVPDTDEEIAHEAEEPGRPQEPEEPGPPEESAEFRRRNRLPQPDQVSRPHFFLLHRFSELYLALREGTLPPVLLATPTALSGHLDPDVLVDRLAACAAAAVEPLSADLLQALLRLPRGAHPGAAARPRGRPGSARGPPPPPPNGWPGKGCPTRKRA